MSRPSRRGRLAVCGRRRQPSGTAHPRGQVPGADRRRGDRGASGRPDAGHRAVGKRMRPPPTITRCRRCSSPIPKPQRSGSRPLRPSRSGHRVRTVDVEIGDAVMGAKLYADGYPGPGADGGRRRPRLPAGSDVRRSGRLGAAALGHRRRCGPSSGRPVVARRTVLSHDQRSMAETA